MSAYFQKASNCQKKERRGKILPKLKEEFARFTFHCYNELHETILLDHENVDKCIWKLLESKQFNWNKKRNERENQGGVQNEVV